MILFFLLFPFFSALSAKNQSQFLELAESSDLKRKLEEVTFAAFRMLGNKIDKTSQNFFVFFACNFRVISQVISMT